MSSPLPEHIASLSKYIRTEKYYELLSSITHDTPESTLRAKFGQNLCVTAKARYLTVNNGIVARDKLVDLVHEEGSFTELVRMVMYFLFMFRDSRYREFICRVVGHQNGKWNSSVFSNAHAEFFQHAGGQKAFTNLRQFLCQTGILDERSWSIHMPDPAGWFPVAAEIAAYSIDNSSARKNFIESPHGFLIRHRLNALLNMTPEELSDLNFGGIYEQNENLLPEIELPSSTSTIDATDFKRWDRKPPSRRRKMLVPIQTDAVALERADAQHFWLEERIFKLCKENGLIAMTSKYVDLTVEDEKTSILFEMKSCRPGAIRAQIRRAVSQLLEYQYLYRKKLKPKVVLCAVVERKPRGNLSWMVSYLENLGIGLIWRNDNNDKLSCTEKTKSWLGDIFPQLKTVEF